MGWVGVLCRTSVRAYFRSVLGSLFHTLKGCHGGQIHTDGEHMCLSVSVCLIRANLPTSSSLSELRLRSSSSSWWIIQYQKAHKRYRSSGTGSKNRAKINGFTQSRSPAAPAGRYGTGKSLRASSFIQTTFWCRIDSIQELASNEGLNVISIHPDSKGGTAKVLFPLPSSWAYFEKSAPPLVVLLSWIRHKQCFNILAFTF